MRGDIKNRVDIETLVKAFYEKVKLDPVIGYIFTDIAKVNWGKHLPVMFDFWENTIFYTGSYTGNPMKTHQHLNAIFPLQPVHFKRWNELFIATADELFEGSNTELAKQRAVSISTVMQLKLFNGIG
ncbi:MAG: group III truncated hemoglobin [Bacteroidota bacterium]